MAAESVNSVLPKFDGKNFSNWLFRIKAVMEEKNCLGALEITVEEAKSKKKTDKDFKKCDIKAKNLIIQTVSDTYLEYIKTDTAAEMIDNLKKVFDRKSSISKLYLRKQLLNLKYNRKEGLIQHFTKFDRIVSEIESCGTKMDESDKVCHLLLTVEQDFKAVVTAMEATNVELTIDYTKSKLLDAEMKENNENSVNKEDCSFMSTKIECFGCKGNHYLRNCPKNRGRGRGRTSRGMYYRGKAKANVSEEKNNHREEKSEEFDSFVACQSSHKERDLSQITFAIDSGATFNMIHRRYQKYMQDVQNIEEIDIRTANGQIIKVNRKGTLPVSYNRGKIKIEALIVDNLSQNLLSVRKLNTKGYDVTFIKEKAKIKRGKLCINGYSDGSLFLVQFKIEESTDSAYVTKQSLGELWHQRMGHLNHGGMRILGLPLSHEKCEICMKAKGTRNSFIPATQPRSRRIGELIHCDIGGPITPETLNGERYYVTIIDDYSHFVEVYPLKQKSDAKEHIIKYINRMKNKRKNVLRLRTDNGGEFLGGLKRFCEEEGIKQEFTCSYTPQQNGVAERMNLTLLDRVRALFEETGLPKYLWNEAIRCAAYQLNRCPTRVLHGGMPADIFLGNTKLDNMRVFGSKAYVIILPRKGKLEPRAKEMRMIGYQGCGYRLWDPETNDIEVSRDVKFLESQYKYQKVEESTRELKEVQINLEDSECEGEEYEEDTEKELSTEKDQKKTMEKEIEQSKEENTVSIEESTERKRRESKAPNYLQDYDLSYIAYALITEDPKSYKEAVEQGGWTEAINKELEAHEKLGTWETAELPKGCKAIDTKWVFRTKHDGTKKARLVARGFQEETTQNVYAPVARMSTVRLFLSKSVQDDVPIKQLDVPTAFLNGELKTDIYIQYPDGVKKEERKVLKLRKALYGLKESPRLWNERLHNFLVKNDLKQSQHDFCLYMGQNVYVLIFVDDILILGNGQKIIAKLKKEFQAKELGNINKFLGMDIKSTEKGLEIKQSSIIEKILLKFNMNNCKGASTPMEINFKINEKAEVIDVPYRELVGSLLYLATISRPDIAFATCYLSRYLDRPTQELWTAGKRILRYLKQTKEKGLIYQKEDNNISLQGFSDSDWAGDTVDRKSVSGAAIFYRGNLVSWMSKKQSTVALSTAEAEYVAAALTVSEMIYIRGVLQDLNCDNEMCYLYIDNQSTIKMIESYENSKRSKHIDIKVHFIKDVVNKNLVKLKYVQSNENRADVLTKSLSKLKHDYLCMQLGLA